MVERLAAELRTLDIHLQVGFRLLLSDIFVEHLRAKVVFDLCILHRVVFVGNYSVFKVKFACFFDHLMLLSYLASFLSARRIISPEESFGSMPLSAVLTVALS